jgi:hypothetical protein
MLKIFRYLLCALMLLSAPSFAAVIIVTNDDVEAGSLPVWTASADPQSYLSKYDYNASTPLPRMNDTIVVLPMSTVPEPSTVLTVMIGLGMLGIAAHKQAKPFQTSD